MRSTLNPFTRTGLSLLIALSAALSARADSGERTDICSKAGNQPEYFACLSSTTPPWKEQLERTRAYIISTLEKKERKIREESAGSISAYISLVEPFTLAEQHWDNWKDAWCEQMTIGGGSGTYGAVLECENKLLQEHIKFLHENPSTLL